ncbi:MAG: hypothetical protein ACLFQ9_08385, partial [Desulfobacterales bacterium]
MDWGKPDGLVFKSRTGVKVLVLKAFHLDVKDLGFNDGVKDSGQGVLLSHLQLQHFVIKAVAVHIYSP